MANFKKQEQTVQKQNDADAIDIKVDTQKKGEVIPTATISKWEKIAGFIFGVTFVTALLILIVFIPNPTPAQWAIFKTILALAAAGVGGILAGAIQVEGALQKWTVRAGGAIALFVLVFFFSPAGLNQDPGAKQIIEEGGTGYQHSGEGDINIGYTIEQHEKALKERELSIQENLEKIHLSQTKNLSLEKEVLELEKTRTGTRIIRC